MYSFIFWMSQKTKSSKDQQKMEEEEEYYEEESGMEQVQQEPMGEEEEDDGIEAPDFLVPSNLQEDEEEIAYYAKKLGIDPDVEEWDDYLIENGYAKILEGITAGRPQKKDKSAEMVKAVRTKDEENARKDFTGLLNRIAPSNFDVIAGQIREAFSTYKQQVAVSQFCRCITQRLFSDAELPTMFIDVYARALREVPDAIQAVLDTVNSRKNETNVKNFLNALGEDTINFYSSDPATKIQNKEVAQLSSIARQMHMNTDVRRGVFYALTTAADVIDATVKIAKLQLTKNQRKDIPIVILECCRSEAKYNLFYAAVAVELCENDKVFQHALGSALRNALHIADDMEPGQLRNSGTIAAELISRGVADFGFLKGTKLMQLSSKAQVFAMVAIREFFLTAEEGVIEDEVQRIAASGGFANDLRKFLSSPRMQRFVQKGKAYSTERQAVIDRVIETLSQK